MKKGILMMSLLSVVAFASYGLEVKATGQFGGYPKIKMGVEAKTRNLNGSTTLFKKFNEDEKVEFKLGGGLELGNTSLKFKLATETKEKIKKAFEDKKNELTEEEKKEYKEEIDAIEKVINDANETLKIGTTYVSPYLAAEINGRVHENFSVYGGANLGYIHHFSKYHRKALPKFSGKVYAGTTYKDMFSVEAGYGLYQGFFGGAGVRFGF